MVAEHERCLLPLETAISILTMIAVCNYSAGTRNSNSNYGGTVIPHPVRGTSFRWIPRLLGRYSGTAPARRG